MTGHPTHRSGARWAHQGRNSRRAGRWRATGAGERNPPLNAIVVERFDQARREAAAADRRRTAGDARPLLGVPFAVKRPSPSPASPGRAGSRLHAGAVADRDAAAVARGCAAGAIPVGTTNVSEFCAGLPEEAPSAAEYVAAFGRLHELERRVDDWFERHPIAICPVAIATAPPSGRGFVEIDGQPPRPGGKLSLSTHATALGLPAASVPAGRDEGGLPIGVRVLGRRGRDRDVLEVVRLLERRLGGWIAPELAPAPLPSTA